LAREEEDSVSEWISVKDDLPPVTGYTDGGTDRVLVKINAHYQPTILIARGEYWEEGFSWYFDGRPYSEDNCEVTHWMPLPEPPQ
jgi:hypothetical protein